MIRKCCHNPYESTSCCCEWWKRSALFAPEVDGAGLSRGRGDSSWPGRRHRWVGAANHPWSSPSSSLLAFVDSSNVLAVSYAHKRTCTFTPRWPSAARRISGVMALDSCPPSVAIYRVLGKNNSYLLDGREERKLRWCELHRCCGCRSCALGWYWHFITQDDSHAAAYYAVLC